MPDLKVDLIPIFDDNYVFVLIDEGLRHALVVDPGDAAAVQEYLEKNDLQLQGILLTHHHHDHVGGVEELRASFQVPVYAPEKNRHQIPYASTYVQEGQEILIDSWKLRVWELPGHTLGHVAFWEENKKWLFSGDVLFGLGCGRLFEGSYEQAFQSLQRIKTLPSETLIYCTHEYTETNLIFCKMLTRLDDSPITGDDEDLELYENELKNRRSLGLPSVPLKLFIEKRVNPFLLAGNVQQFTYLRDLRNKQ